MAPMALGSTEWVNKIIQEDEFGKAPLPSLAKVDRLGDYHPQNEDINGWVQENNQIDDATEHRSRP